MAAFLDEDGYIDQRVCRFYLFGNCLSGNRCKFLHCKELLKTKITWVCLHFLTPSGCTYGINCKFDHPEWAKGLSLLPKICGQYRHERDGEQCSDKDCKYLHFTDEEHQAYIKDRIIPERYDRRARNDNRLVQYSSDEENQLDDMHRDYRRARGDSRSRDRNGRNSYRAPKYDRSRSPKPDRGRSPKRARSRSPKRARSRSPVRSNTNREESPEGGEMNVEKLKRTIKDLKVELSELSKDNKHLRRQLHDHKRFHDSDQELINDLVRARDKLEDDVNRLNDEKEQMTKQISDLFSDNKVVVEENQRLRGLLQQAQESQTRLSTASHSHTPMAQSSYPDPFSTSHNASSAYQQTSWN